MHVLIVSHSCATALNQELHARIQRETGWKITLVVPDLWRDEFGNELRQPPCEGLESSVIRCAVWKNGSIIFHVYRMRWHRFLRELKPDVIYMNHEPYALATAQVCHANNRTIRVPFGFYSCQNINKKYPPPFSWLESMVYRSSNFAFPITDSVANVLKAKGYEGRQTVCALPLDPERYHPRLRQNPPERFPKSESPVIGYVGRLVEPKGLRTLATALGMIRDLDWRMVLVGTGDFQPEFERLLTEQGVRDRIFFAGYVPHDETPRWLASMDMLVLPSETQPNWEEQFGRVIPEAMACGTPVIGSDSGEIPHLIRRGEGGLVFTQRQPDEFAVALRQLITGPKLRRQLAENGRHWVEHEISLPAVAGKMIEAFETAVMKQDRGQVAAQMLLPKPSHALAQP
ncbi:glycosyltransferase family 4 protein [Prosthecobacter sp.]|uniref:glycosyltransferase family 4 protein n=1 Tax=Prosthecobacter sp. TaxID=1965333 RepID=UPI001E0CD05C|nr:glycosyltransferase family 4 protein [Prosthecobacter sp.]MCB1277991.1 glycosyltransferase family 4 protein [Prosthecobacter sp.]